ncbi:MAG TPA: FAD/NAD(P)-binding oxidoreductase [Planctomycetaceae bacterium]|nr:FAD/NAD(P)-binding oxidoreductase [Planctomycetaceae bacterium]
MLSSSSFRLPAETPRLKHQIVIVGGGSGGITVAARLLRSAGGKKLDVAIVEPSTRHYYQPAWTLVGAGTFRLEDTVKPEADVIPPGASWIQERVAEFHPAENLLVMSSGLEVAYEYLVVAAGIQINWNGVPGLAECIGKDGVCSNYSFDTVTSTWETLRKFQGGTAIFTQPAGAIKCGGAPQKICYLAEDFIRKRGLRDKSRIIYASPGTAIFSVEKYRKVLEEVVERKGIETMFRHNLIGIREATKEAVFENLDTKEIVPIKYDMLHVTPPQSAPDFISQSPLADEHGWVEVDQYNLQHKRFPNVFSLGDCSSLPTSKTGAAIRKQAPVLVKNLLAHKAGKPLEARYNGYTSCPVVTGYGKMVLAEFDYNHEPVESFPFNQAKERWTMWILKKYILPPLYWSGMLKGLV